MYGGSTRFAPSAKAHKGLAGYLFTLLVVVLAALVSIELPY